MAEREDLEVQLGTCAYESAEHRQNGHQHGRHSDKSLPASVGKFNGINTFEVFRTHTRVGDMRELPFRNGEFDAVVSS